MPRRRLKTEGCCKQCIMSSSIRYFARQGIALRGRTKTDDTGKTSEPDSNLIQLLKTRADDDPVLHTWLQKSQNKFTSPDIQNEILMIMAQKIVRDIVNQITGKWYTIMVDETTDLSNTEQMAFCLRYVDDDLDVHEELIGLNSLESTKADTITETIKDNLLRLNLRLDNCRGQCYDGASAMSGAKSVVATQILAEEPRALYTHCYGHALSFAAQDTLKSITIMRDALDTVQEMTKLIKLSPKREVIFKKIKDEITSESPGIRTLCPTRWTVRAEAFASISENYQTLQMTWDAAKEASRDTEMRARITGVSSQMDKFDFFFGVEHGRKILGMTDNLSRSLQAKDMSACQGQNLVKMTLGALSSIRSDLSFDLFWNYLEQRRSSTEVSSPVLPRRRKAPRRYEIGHGDPDHPVSVEDHYQRIYFEAVDLVMSAIKNRFEQKGFQMFQKMEALLTSVTQSGNIEEVTDFYGNDISSERLQTQLTIFRANRKESDLKSTVAYLKSLSHVEKEYFSEVVKLVKLILVMPATHATSERSFSALRRLNTLLRTTEAQSRLNWMMALHVHKDRTDALPLKEIANEFVSRNQSRKNIFGIF